MFDDAVPSFVATQSPPPRLQLRKARIAGLLIAITAVVVLLGGRWPTFSSQPSIAPTAAPSRGAEFERQSPRLAAESHSPTGRLGLGEADGAVPAGTTVFNDAVPGVVKLNPDLLGALRRAATQGAGPGREFYVDSGWRSAAYQSRLLQEATAKYGSRQAAMRWVATPQTSAHVRGNAVDIGPSGAATWLAEHGAAYGLCQIYANEPWHFELRPDAVSSSCPALYADPTQDPRMQR